MGFDNLSDKVNEFTNRKKELQADSDIFDLENQQVNDIFDMLNSSDAEIVKAVQDVHGTFDAEGARLQLQKELAEESRRDLVKEIGDEKQKLDTAGSKLAALKGKKYIDGVNAAADKCDDLQNELNALLSQLDEGIDMSTGAGGGSGGGDSARPGAVDSSVSKSSDMKTAVHDFGKTGGSAAAGDRYDNAKQLYSTFAERVKHTPASDNEFGSFTGERGNSFFQFNQPVHIDIPDSKDISGIPYKNGVVDFSSVSAGTVSIKHMTSDLPSNFNQAYTAFAKKWNKEGFEGRHDWQPRDVKQWCKDHSYTVHECSDRRHCQLVPRIIHDKCRHSGGRFECGLRDGGKGFD